MNIASILVSLLHIYSSLFQTFAPLHIPSRNKPSFDFYHLHPISKSEFALYYSLLHDFYVLDEFFVAFIHFQFVPFLCCLCFSTLLLYITLYHLFVHPLTPFCTLLYYSNEIQITSLYQSCQLSQKLYFHVMKLAYNPFKAVKPWLNINTPHY